MSPVEEGKKDLVNDVHRLTWLCIRLKDSPNGGFVVHYNFESSLMFEMKSKRHFYPLLMELRIDSLQV